MRGLLAPTSKRTRARRSGRGFTLLELLTVISIILFMIAFLVGVFLRFGNTNKIRASQKLIERIGIGLSRYYADLRSYPPDTGYGLTKQTLKGPINMAGDMGVVYDTGALWRYLGNEVKVYHTDGSYWKTVGPYIQFKADELVEYSDSAYPTKSYYVVDAWNVPIGYVADPRRVIHNRGDFDLYSAGPDKMTASDVSGATPNTAYDGSNRDDASEMGGSAENGTYTGTRRNWVPPNGPNKPPYLDDLNNWDPQK
jgi:prepilin-type N-terminal cleavage/methylation domain-containing protein